MRGIYLALTIAAVAGCSAGSAERLMRPAPDREVALECGMQRALELGFSPVGGGVGDGHVRLARNRSASGSDIGKSLALRVSTMLMVGYDRIIQDRLTISGTDEAITVDAAGVRESGEVGAPSPEGRRAAERVLMQCSAGPTSES